MKFFIHSYVLLASFVTVFAALSAALATTIAVGSFVLWTIPPIPTIATIYFSIRLLAVTSALIVAMYASTRDYSDTVDDMLGR
jgi:hypothetical protein